MLRTTRVIFVGFSIALAAPPGAASEPKKWEQLSYCHYLPHKNNDGDSFHVKCLAKEFVLRLYYVDAPEANLSYAQRTYEQSVHFGITLAETMKAGAQAAEVVQKTLKGPFVVWTRWADALGRSREPRYYGLVTQSGKDLGEILVAEGLARNKGVRPNLPSGEKASAYREELFALEDLAQKRRVGAWANSTKQAIERD